MQTFQKAAENQAAIPPQSVEPKTYYSTSLSLMIHPSSGEQVVQNGRLVGTFGEVIEHFVPCGDYGMLRTANPVTIDWIERQMQAGRNDIISAEEYNRRITPAEVHVAKANAESRELKERNEALEALVEQYRQRDEAAAKQAAAKGK